MLEHCSCDRPGIGTHLLVPCRRLSSAFPLPLAAYCCALTVPAAATKVRASCPGTPHSLSYDPVRGCLSTSISTAIERVQNTSADGAVASSRSGKLCGITCVQDWTAYVCLPLTAAAEARSGSTLFCSRGGPTTASPFPFGIHRLAQWLNAHGFRHTHTIVIQH